MNVRKPGTLIWIACLALAAAAPGCGDDDSGGDADVADVHDTPEADVEPEADVPTDVEDVSEAEAESEASVPRRLTILHTNDTHAHFMGLGPELEYSPDTTGDDPTIGGFSRLAALIAARRTARLAEGNDVIVTDSGDFMMGTLFEALDRAAAPPLTLFQAMGYDAVTLGNHEFDWGSDHLARVLAAAAVDERFDIPILATNMITDDTDPGDDRLEALVADGTIARSTILDLPGGLRVGLLSWLGKGAAAVAPMKAPVTFDEDMTAAQTIAAALRADGADVVVALTHIGLAAGLGDPIDDNLARAAEDIDVIVGGHSHDALDEVRVVDGTLIVQAGAYTRFLGELTVEIDGDAVTLVDYVLHPIDDSIEGDAEMQSFVERYIAAVDVACTPVGVTYFEEVAETAFDLTTPGLAESNLGNLVTDAYRTLAAAVTSADPVIAAFESDGVIRDDILAGDEGVIAFADVFRALPLGIGPDRFPGYPLVSFWVTGAELKNACEVSASLSGVAGGDYFIQISGLRCRRDPTAAWLGRVQEVFLGNDIAGYDATPVDLADTTTLYRVAVDLYVAGLMSVIGDYTFGMLQIVPKQSDGTPVADMTAMILDGDPLTAGVQEMKLWGVLWTYLTMFPDADADTLPDVPALYAAPTGRYYAE